MLDANLWRSIPTVDRATVIESVEENEEVDAARGACSPEASDQVPLRALRGPLSRLRPGRRAASLALSRSRVGGVARVSDTTGFMA